MAAVIEAFVSCCRLGNGNRNQDVWGGLHSELGKDGRGDTGSLGIGPGARPPDPRGPWTRRAHQIPGPREVGLWGGGGD